MNRVSFFNSLSGRLVLLGVLPAMLAIGVIVALSAIEGYRSAQVTQERILAADAEGAAAELSVRNDRWNSTAAILALSQPSGLFGRRKETVEFLRSTNGLSDLNLSMYIVYEPNADGQDAEALKSGTVPSEAMDKSGRFVPVWYDEYQSGVRTGKTSLKPSVDMESLDYYLLPKKQFAESGKATPMIIEPYVKEGQMLISHVCPIVVQGKFVGVAGVNRSLDVLSKIAGAIRARSQADVFMLSSGGAFIAATTDEANQSGTSNALKDRPISETPYSALASRWQSANLDGTANAFEAHDPVLDEQCMYAVSRLRTGDWTVVVRRPKSEVMRAAKASVYRNVGLGAVLMLVGGGVMLLMARSISRRVRVAADVADRIARGDLTRAVDKTTSRDETGVLMESMRVMDGNLNGLVGSVKQASIHLNSTATEIAATAKQQEGTASTFGAGSSQIAAAVKEISATSQDLVRTMETVNTMAVETADLATAGQAGLQGMETVMHDLDRATTAIAEKLSAINDRSQKITAVITTITKVADQTNILSINAAIEAEKAGEYGAGFLVIAREIRRLADQTASATLDIEQMVQQMQAAVSAGVMEMDRFSDQVRRGVRDVASAGTQLTKIIDRVNRSTASFKQVNESMQAQSEGAQQISDAMASLVANANQTMQSVREFGKAATDLQSAIASLRQSVAQFRLKE